MVFDASGSTSSDGSALSYAWDFGNGRRGGGRTIAQVFTSGGARDVTLTVVDGKGRSAQARKSIAIQGPAPAARTLMAQGLVRTVAGDPLEGVTVTVVGSATSATTDALGTVALALDVDMPLTLALAKNGYADQFVALQLPATTGLDAYFEATLATREAALTLADAAAGGALAGKDGATLTLPPSALVDSSGAAVTGAVQVSVTPVDITAPAAGGFPGQFEGVNPDASLSPIVSFGTTEFVPTRSGLPLQLAPGKTAQIDLPVYADSQLDGTALAVGDKLPLWSLDEQSGLWIQEGEGTVVAVAGSPTGLALRGTVAHLSWWNADIGFLPYGPKPKCVYDDSLGLPGGSDTFATATICKMLAEMDRPPAGSPVVGTRRSPAVTTATPRLPGFSRSVIVPIAGGLRIPVPANVPIALNGSALNGTWQGKTVVNGPVGEEAEVLIKMQPITGGGTGQLITLPYDQTASLDTGQTARYSFAGAPLKWARITVSQANGSTLAGGVRLLQGATELGSASFSFSPGVVTRALPGAGTFTIEITGTANTPGAFRLQVELLGTVQDAALALPLDVTATVPAFTMYRGTFDASARTGLALAFQRQSTGAYLWRVRTQSGTLVFDSQVSASSTVSTGSALLPAPGPYVLEVLSREGVPAGFRVTSEVTSWVAVAPATIAVQSTTDLVDLIADRNGAPVLVHTRQDVVGGESVQSISLDRWSGSAWVPAAPDVPRFPRACYSLGATFDNDNQPVVVYADSEAGLGAPARVNIRRYSGGTWQAIGPNGGVLPNKSPYYGACAAAPVVRIGTDNMPIVAYRADETLWVQKLQGNQWVGLVAPGGDSFTVLNGGMDLAIDPSGRPVFAYTGLSGTFAPTVLRLRTTPTVAWEPLGPNGGVIPFPAGTRELYSPRLRFDASGNPIVGAMASVYTSPGVWTGGTAVVRFDGSAWQGSGGYRISDDSYAGGASDMGFALFGGDAVMGWVNARQNGLVSPVVQRNTSSGWSAIGADDGRIPQFTQHGLIQDTGWSMRLLPVGSELYLALVDRDPNSALGGQVLQLLRYVH